MPIPLVTELDQTPDPVMYSQPTSPSDASGGRYCTTSGMWAAARDIVYVDGAPYIREFAPSCSAKQAASLIARFRKNIKSPV